MSTAKNSVELFEQQKRRHAELQQRRAKAEATRDAERVTLQRAREEAKQLLGTDDVAELRRLYQEGEAENDRKVVELVFALDEADRKLGDIDRITAAR